MSDFGLGDNALKGEILLENLRWHGLDPAPSDSILYMDPRTGNPGQSSSLNVEVKDGMVSDSGTAP